jgi:hypothetical protein
MTAGAVGSKDYCVSVILINISRLLQVIILIVISDFGILDADKMEIKHLKKADPLGLCHILGDSQETVAAVHNRTMNFISFSVMACFYLLTYNYACGKLTAVEPFLRS